MKKLVLLAAALGVAVAGFAGQTATLIKTRSSAKSAVTPGKWHAGFSACKKYALANDVPLIAVWSNGDSCGHCVNFESSVNSTVFKNWMKTSGCVFYFIYSGDGGDGSIGSDVFHWIRKNKNTAYPFVRIYWPAGKVDVATIGDTVDGNKNGTKGGEKAIAYFKSKLKSFSPLKVDPALPYSIDFYSNPPDGMEDLIKGEEMERVVDALYATPTNLPQCAYSLTNHVFSGWAKTPAGSVVYKDKQAVSKVTSVSNEVVALYARWTRTTYGPFYTKVKKTINVTDYKGTKISGYKTTSKIPGLAWNTKGYWTGTPTKAGTYTVTFTKSSSKITRKFVIVADTITIPETEGSTIKTDLSTTLDKQLETVSGGLSDVTITSLKDNAGVAVPLADFGLSVSDSGEITGRPKKEGTYKLTVKGKAASGLTLSKTVIFEVTEGDILLLNGLAHADELWATAGTNAEYPLAVRLKDDDGKGGSAFAFAEIKSLEVNGEVAEDPSKLVLSFDDPGDYTVSVKVTYMVDNDEEEMETEFKVTVL